MNIKIRYAEAADYDGVESIMKDVQQLHVDWRPDVYKPTDAVYPRDYFGEHLVAEKRLLVAEQEGVIVGLLSFLYRHSHQISRSQEM